VGESYNNGKMTFLSLLDLNSFNDDQEADVNEEKLNLLGGVTSLEKSLGTNFEKGISGGEDVFEQRRNLYGKNEVIQAVGMTARCTYNMNVCLIFMHLVFVKRQFYQNIVLSLISISTSMPNPCMRWYPY
jgi:hypothetical protein